MPERDDDRRLNAMWEAARSGDAGALDELLRFIVTKGRLLLLHYIRRNPSRPTGRTSEVLQRTAVRILEQATRNIMVKPSSDALKTLGSYVWRVARETERFERSAGGPRRGGRLELTEVEAYLYLRERREFQAARDLPELEEHLRDLDRLRRAIDALSPRDRAIVQERLGGRTEKEIAQALGASHESVRQRYHRAVRRLAGSLRPPSRA